MSESANTCVREHVTHSQPVYISSKSDKRSKSGKAGQWDGGIHFGTSRLTRSVDT